MSYRYFLSLILFVLVACSPDSPSGGVEVNLLIENVNVIDPIDGEIGPRDVAIHDGRIISVAERLDLAAQKSALRIDGTGKYLIPGLWDAHIHLTYTEGLDHRVFFPLAIAHGVTSLRDTGGHIDLLAEARHLAAKDPVAPNLYVSGPLIDGKKRIYDGSSPFLPDLSVGVATPKEARLQIEALAVAEVDFVKAYELLEPDVFSALMTAAAENGLPVALHSPLSMTPQQTISLGARDMQHLRNLELGCATNADELLEQRKVSLSLSQESGGKLRSRLHTEQRVSAVKNEASFNCDTLIKIMADHDVMQTPTLTITRFLTRRLFGDESFRATFDYVPSGIAEGWKTRSQRLLKTPVTTEAKIYDDWVVSMIGRLDKAGVPIMAGTDAPIGYLTPGASLHAELGLLVEAGLSPLSALESATVTPARFFGLENKMGRVKPNYKADLVLLSENPLYDIGNTLKIEAVVKSGRYLDRKYLDALRIKARTALD